MNLVDTANQPVAVRGHFSWRAFFVAALAVLLAGLVMAGAAEAKPKFSAIAVDARNGKVLFSSDPDGLRHPASLTKVMTLYLLFQDLKAGKVKLDTKFRVSARAAGMAPSKLGVKPGSTISVDNAIRALVTKSANDIAATIGENLAGSEAAFAARMTKTARSLGMSRTVFKNASGLPDPAQVTTARDMATLSLRIQRDFPQYYPYFRIMSFTYNGRVIKTHNRLLGRYQGTDGIKTGYIGASGFNLTSSARRGDKRVVGVVMGATSGASRNAYMMKMLDKAFPKCAGGKTIAALAGSSKGAIDPLAGKAATPVETAEETPQPAEQPEAETASVQPVEAVEADEDAGEGDNRATDETATGTTFKKVEKNGGKKPEKKQPESQTPEVIEAELQPETAANNLPGKLPFEVKQPANQTTIAAIAETATESNWQIQIGTYRNKHEAQQRLRKFRDSKLPILDDKLAITVTVDKGGEITYRARFSGFTEEAAKDACKLLTSKNITCVPLAAPQS